MNVKNLLLFFLILSCFLETTVVSFPLVVICSFFLFILFPSLKIFAAIFAAGLLLDSLKAGNVGATPLFLFCVFLLLTLYQKVFNFKDLETLVFFIFAGAILYSYLFLYSVNLFTYALFFAVLLLAVRYFKKSLEIQ